MKKAYIIPQTTTVQLSTISMLAASDEPGRHDEYIEAAQLSNDRSWSNEEWSEE